MKIKTKLTLGVGLLFILIILLSVVGAFNINALKSDTENILKANYNSLLYSRNILLVLNNPPEKSFQQIELNLIEQENNITETGEKEATKALRNSIEAYRQKSTDSTLMLSIQQNLFQIMELNMHAIQQKSEIAKKTADSAVFWIAITGTLCFFIAFTLLYNLPSNIANPIKELSNSIKEIASQNYDERVHFESHNEFGDLAVSFNTMAEKLQEYRSGNLEKILIEKKRIEILINNMNEPVIGLDDSNRVIFMNDNALKITGLNNENVIGKQAQDIALQNDLFRTLIQDIFSSEKPNLKVPIKIYADEKESYFRKEFIPIKIIPTGEKEEKLIGNVILLQNITEFQELDFAKTNFIAMVSHEFKTPISSMKMSLQLMENEQIGSLNDEQKGLVNNIKDDISRLLKITTELLNMTQVESGNIQLSLLPTDPKEILTHAINSTQTQAHQKQIKFDTHYLEKMVKINVDTEKTTWVLTNLISNAIRYSYENSIIYLAIKEENNQIQISVRDTGQGIAPQYKDKVFNRYFRVPDTKIEGTGLGLAISKDLIEAQGGQIKVESEFGAGSTFSITFNTLA